MIWSGSSTTVSRRQARLDPDADALPGSLEEADGGACERGEVGRLRAHLRQAREARELVHERLQEPDLLDDDPRAALDRLGQVGLAGPEPAQDALGGEADRRQRVLDLVRDAAGDFVPRRELLLARDVRRVLDREHPAAALAPGGRRTAAGRRSSRCRSPPSSAIRTSSRGEVAGRAGPRLLEQRDERREVLPGGERDGGDLGVRETSRDARGRVADGDLAVRVERDDARRDGLEHGREEAALELEPAVGGLQLFVGVQQRPARLLEARGHLVEGLDEHGELVGGRHVDAGREIARAQPPVDAASAPMGPVIRRARVRPVQIEAKRIASVIRRKVEMFAALIAGFCTSSFW